MIHIKTSQVKKTYIFVPLLRFETHEFCINILLYDFCTDCIRILWYCKFVMQEVRWNPSLRVQVGRGNELELELALAKRTTSGCP